MCNRSAPTDPKTIPAWFRIAIGVGLLVLAYAVGASTRDDAGVLQSYFASLVR